VVVPVAVVTKDNVAKYEKYAFNLSLPEGRCAARRMP